MTLLTTARDLKRRKARERGSLFVAEGIRAVEVLLDSSVRARGALVSPRLLETERGRALNDSLRAHGQNVEDVTDREFASAANTDAPQGVLVVAEIPERTLADIHVKNGLRLLLLDAVQDPGNAGTLLRTAAAFAVDSVIALPGSVDLWSAKVVRSAMGSQFNHLCMSCTWSDVGQFLARHSIELWGAEAGARPPDESDLPTRLALAVGNEGAGLSPEVRSHMSRAVGVPIAPGVESLNVAVAAGILLHAVTL